MNKLTLGYSSCPNDCFIFDALVHHKIDTEGLEFEVVMEDVEALNKRAFNASLDITKLSYHAYAYCSDNYVLLDSGSALGNSCGPLLISKKDIKPEEVNSLKIGIPGKYTTANFLLSLAFPAAPNKVEMVFSEIEDAVLNGKVDAGLIIHENRFTYEQKGLKKIKDLGEYWEESTGYPIPLGGIVIRRNLSNELKERVNQVLQKSVEYALLHPTASLEYVRKHAQEMNPEVMMKHINLYVNHYSIRLGKEGRQAVEALFKKALELKVIPEINNSLFLN